MLGVESEPVSHFMCAELPR